MNSAILLLSCPDRSGLVARIAHFLFERGGNILDLDEHVDPDEERFSIRVEWDLDGFSVPASEIHDAFRPLAKEFKANWQIRFSAEPMKMAIFVSRHEHCLQEILWRHQMNEIAAKIVLIISNHRDAQTLAAQYKIPFHHFPLNKENKTEQEARELGLLGQHEIDVVVLARYMQILSADFVDRFRDKIINIHHSFLPAFAGGDPYRQAYDRGVKIIGATSHYVTPDLDEGPIIDQDIVRISHRDSVSDLKRKGRDLERIVLARAIRAHCDHRVLVHGKKTVVFGSN